MNFFPGSGQLTEIVGRNSAESWGELDTVSVIFEGNSSLANTAPQVGASGAIIGYPTFEVATRVREVIPGGKTRVRVRFVGLFSGATIGAVARDITESEQELGFQQFYVTTILPTGGTPSSPGSASYQVGTVSGTLRYLSQNDNFRYVCKGLPSGPRFIGAPTIKEKFVRASGATSGQIIGVNPVINLVTLFENSGPQTSVASVGGGGLSIAAFVGNGPWGYSGPNVYCSQFTAHAISPNWYECQEVWTARYLPGTLFTI